MSSKETFCEVRKLQDEGILLVEDGNHGEYRPRPNEFGRGQTKFIRAADISGGTVLFDSSERITDQAVQRIRKGIGRGGDILFSHKGTVGKIALTEEDAPLFVCSPQTTFWRVLDPDRLDRRFLYYFMQSETFKRQWHSRKGETDMADYVSLTAQRQFVVPILGIDEQRAIGQLLGALDDKIELNRQMNRTLESLAQAIFRSWFVDFDPVVAKAEGRKPFGMTAEMAALFPERFMDSEIGPMPDGWSPARLENIALNPRRTVQPKDLSPETPFIGLEHMPRMRISLTEWARAEQVQSAKVQFFKGEILFGKLRPYFHKVGVAPVDGVCSTDILVIRPRSAAWFGLLLGHLSSTELVAHADATSGGTRQPRTSWNSLGQFQISLPEERVASAFSQLAQGFTSVISNNILENHTLAELRDLLLPKLLSGEIRLRQAEKVVEQAL